MSQTSSANESNRPNMIVILCDDVGFSDIGCYGSEIPTPRLDGLAARGVRFTQFYNNARCCPSRASLLTGLYAHRAGVGHMLHGNRFPGYADKLSSDSVTMAEVLKAAGYRTYMSGKWHVVREISPDGPKDCWPLQRGFEKYYGIITGASNYYDPTTLCRGNQYITVENDPQYQPEEFYFTDAITDNALMFMSQHNQETPAAPFFMYVAYTAAHWPMQAPSEEIEKHLGRYNEGYDAVRRARFDRMKKLGIIREDLQWSPTVGDWTSVEDKQWEARNMETYAAMITRMDTGIGRIVDQLAADGKLDNTLIMFIQDNGGCAEPMWRDEEIQYHDDLKPMSPDELQTKIWPPMQTRDGRPVRTGRSVLAGPEDSYLTYGENWANVSNTPFREYKHWVHEGGIATPLIVHWPAGVPQNLNDRFEREPTHLVDVMPTLLDAAAVKYPEVFNGTQVAPVAGVSMMPLLQGRQLRRGCPIFWEHESNLAVRDGKWKLVCKYPGPWELYDMESDRAEMHDLIEEYPDVAKGMADQWQAWAEANQVLPLGAWEIQLQEDLNAERRD